jgi:programmed cell death protein 5
MDSDANEIKRRMLQQIQEDQQIQAEEQAIEAQKKVILRQILDSRARERLARIRIARPETAALIENQLIQLFQMGKIKEKLNEKQFLELVKYITPKKRDINIRRI